MTRAIVTTHHKCAGQRVVGTTCPNGQIKESFPIACVKMGHGREKTCVSYLTISVGISTLHSKRRTRHVISSHTSRHHHGHDSDPSYASASKRPKCDAETERRDQNERWSNPEPSLMEPHTKTGNARRQ
jgi:hypothetical protein